MLSINFVNVFFFITLFFAIAISEDVNSIPRADVTKDPLGIVPKPRTTLLDFIFSSSEHQVLSRLLPLGGSSDQGTDDYLGKNTSRAFVFAPTDSAWSDYARYLHAYQLPQDLLLNRDPTGVDAIIEALLSGWSQIARIGPNELPDARRTVRHHIVPNSLSYPELEQMGTINTLAGLPLTLVGDIVVDQDPGYNVTVGAPRFLLNNGWLVSISQVIIPFNMTDAWLRIEALPSVSPTVTPTPSFGLVTASPSPSESKFPKVPSKTPRPYLRTPTATPVLSQPPFMSSSSIPFPEVSPTGPVSPTDPVSLTVTPDFTPPVLSPGAPTPRVPSEGPDLPSPSPSLQGGDAIGEGDGDVTPAPSDVGGPSVSVAVTPSAQVPDDNNAGSVTSTPDGGSEGGDGLEPSPSVDGILPSIYPSDGALVPTNSMTASESPGNVIGEDDPSPTATEESGGDGVCFPASARVALPDGSHVRMDQLNAGTLVAHNEDFEASKVFLFTHRSHHVRMSFRRLKTACDLSLTVSGNHYVYVGSKNDGRMVAADQVRAGDLVRTVKGACVVVDVSVVSDIGLFAPHSIHGDLIVDGFVVSGYSRALNPRIAHAFLLPVRWVSTTLRREEPLGSLLYHGANWALRFLPRGRNMYSAVSA